MFKKITHSFLYGKHKVRLETGVMARQATSAVLIDMDGTVVLVTVVVSDKVKSGQDFFPLSVDYFEKFYASGKIPSGYIKRETKASDQEVLIARLIDRPIRPLFVDGFFNEINLVAQVISLNKTVSPDIVAMIGASSALCLAGLPFLGPIAGARVGYINDQFVLNPSNTELIDSKLDLVVAGTSKAVLMVESEAGELPDNVMLDAISFGFEHFQPVIKEIEHFVSLNNTKMQEWPIQAKNEHIDRKIADLVQNDIANAYLIVTKKTRENALSKIRDRALDNLLTWQKSLIESVTNQSDSANNTIEPSLQLIAKMDTEEFKSRINNSLFALEASTVRNRIINGEPRIDGRDTKTVRPINIDIGLLPNVHGSALFTRGETQALAITTLGTKSDEQMVNSILGDYSEKFMLNYNFPPFATGENGKIGAPKRREIGHGNLAKRAVKPIIPMDGSFPCAIRVVSEIIGSNGSSSMASVCGASLSMMDAGIPIKEHVAGIAMGLILEDGKFAVLTDILGDEDHLGDMDFKVAGTKRGITALQMDIKTTGINSQIMKAAIIQARDGINHILDLMNDVIAKPREMSDKSPAMHTIQIDPDKIKTVIGKGGSMIKSIIANTGADINVESDGTVNIFCNNKAGADKAKTSILEITENPVIGNIYNATVVKILDKNVGAIVSILSGSREGMVHISQISEEKIENINDVLKKDQKIKVKLVAFDEKGRLKFSMRTLGE